jgi:hypothetical protein
VNPESQGDILWIPDCRAPRGLWNDANNGADLMRAAYFPVN